MKRIYISDKNKKNMSVAAAQQGVSQQDLLDYIVVEYFERKSKSVDITDDDFNGLMEENDELNG